MAADPEKPRALVRFYRNVFRFSLLGLLSGILVLAFVVARLVSHVESMMPAEFHLILQLLRNRFFR